MSLSHQIDSRSAQFSSLESVILGRQLSAQVKPSGRPVREGYISSYFGERMDPFNGEEAMHKGVDFATDAGADVLAVAAGIVTWSGPREGYGNLIEINHGNGYTTRYAHNAETLVTVGDTVQRGQAVAVVGSTGRSTGPHVHFEVAPRRYSDRSDGVRRPLDTHTLLPRLRRRQNDYFGALSTLTIASSRPRADSKPLTRLNFSEGLLVLQALTRVFGSRNDRLIKSYGRMVRDAAVPGDSPCSRCRTRHCATRRRSFASGSLRAPRSISCCPRRSRSCARPPAARCGCGTSMCS